MARGKKTTIQAPPSRAFCSEWAKFWRVTPRTIQRWLKSAGVPRPDAVDDMIRWAAGPDRKPRAFLVRVAELRIERETAARPPVDPTAPPQPKGADAFTDPDWAEFERERLAGASSDPQEQQQTLEKLRDYYAFKLRKANRLNDENSIRNFSDLVIKYEKAIRDNKLAADKLGIDTGDLLPRTAHEALIAAAAYWSLRSIDGALDTVCRRLLNLNFPEEARAVLEPVLLSTRFFDPMVHSARTSAANALPDWFVEKLIDVADDYIEHGRALFTAELSAVRSAVNAIEEFTTATFTDGDGI